jgi:hypothetical protein
MRNRLSALLAKFASAKELESAALRDITLASIPIYLLLAIGIGFLGEYVGPIFALLSMAIIPPVAVFAIVLWYIDSHPSRRRQQLLLNWQETPLRWEPPYVIQTNRRGVQIGAIDTKGHYTVRWDYFDAERAVYTIVQGSERIVVSTLADNAPTILVGALRVRNYPCLEWPNLDL